MRAIATDVASSVICMSVCLPGTLASAQQKWMNRSRYRFRIRLLGPRNHVSDKVHTGATWRIQRNNLCGNSDVGCCNHSSGNLLLWLLTADRRSAGHAAIDRYLLLAGPTAANLLGQRAAAGWDRQMDRRTDDRQLHRPYLAWAYYVDSANKSSRARKPLTSQ